MLEFKITLMNFVHTKKNLFLKRIKLLKNYVKAAYDRKLSRQIIVINIKSVAQSSQDNPLVFSHTHSPWYSRQISK